MSFVINHYGPPKFFFGPLLKKFAHHWFRQCFSHLIYTVRPCLIHTYHAVPTPRPWRAPSMLFWVRLLKITAQHGRGAAWYVRISLTIALVSVISSPFLLTTQKETSVRFTSTNISLHVAEPSELHELSQFFVHTTRAINSTNKCHLTAWWPRGMPNDQMISPALYKL